MRGAAQQAVNLTCPGIRREAPGWGRGTRPQGHTAQGAGQTARQMVRQELTNRPVQPPPEPDVLTTRLSLTKGGNERTPRVPWASPAPQHGHAAGPAASSAPTPAAWLGCSDSSGVLSASRGWGTSCSFGGKRATALTVCFLPYGPAHAWPQLAGPGPDTRPKTATLSAGLPPPEKRRRGPITSVGSSTRAHVGGPGLTEGLVTSLLTSGTTPGGLNCLQPRGAHPPFHTNHLTE